MTIYQYVKGRIVIDLFKSNDQNRFRIEFWAWYEMFNKAKNPRWKCPVTKCLTNARKYMTLVLTKELEIYERQLQESQRL